jgi:hypothetical protein
MLRGAGVGLRLQRRRLIRERVLRDLPAVADVPGFRLRSDSQVKQDPPRRWGRLANRGCWKLSYEGRNVGRRFLRFGVEQLVASE